MLWLKKNIGKLPMMMDCREHDAFIDDYLDDALPFKGRVKFELHIKMCPACRAYLEAYRRAREMAKGAAEDFAAELSPMPEDLVEAILKTKRAI